MKKIQIMIIMVTIELVSLFAQNEVSPFSYDIAKQQSGTAFFYKVTNLDKAQYYDIILYQEDETTFDTIYDLSNIIPQIQIGTQNYSIQYFCYDYSSNYNPYVYARIVNTNDKSEMTYDLKNRKITGSISTVNLFKTISSFPGNLNVLSVPSYEISGGQTDLWYSMRFVKKNIKEFTVGTHTVLKAYNERVIYAGEEIVDGKTCDKWEAIVLDKKGSLTKEKQIFWFDTTSDYYQLAKTEVHMKGGLFHNAVIELTGTKQFSNFEWKEYVSNLTEAVRVKLDIPVQE